MQYLAEGNAHIIFSLSNNTAKVLRVRKVPPSSSASVQEELARQALERQIVSAVIGSGYSLEISDIRHLNSEELDELNQQLVKAELEGKRSVKWLGSRVQPRCVAMWMLNLAQPSISLSNSKSSCLINDDDEGWEDFICVEVKPKWGFIPSPIAYQSSSVTTSSTSVTSTTRQKQKCRMCMKRTVESSSALSQLSDESNVCLLPLFSADLNGIERCLRRMFVRFRSHRKPYNNLLLFYKGLRISAPLYNTDDSKNACQLPGNSETENDEVEAMFYKEWFDALPKVMALIVDKTGILRRLAQNQRGLDSHSIDRVFDIFSSLSSSTSAYLERLRNGEVSLWKTVFEEYITEVPFSSFTSTSRADIEDGDDGKWDDVRRMVEYLISMSLKDLSIMFRLHIRKSSHESPPVFNKNSENNNNLSSRMIECDGYVFEWDVKVVDVDMKQVDKVPHYFHMERTIIHSYFAQNNVDTEDFCGIVSADGDE